MHDMINVYPITIITYLYPLSNNIISLSYHAPETDPNFLSHENEAIHNFKLY